MDARERIYGMVNEKLKEQNETISSLDTKISILAGANGLFLSLAFGLERIPARPGFWFYWGGSLTLLLALALVLWAYRPRRWFFPPDPERMGEFLEAESSDGEILKTVTESICMAYAENRALMTWKSSRMAGSLVLTVLGLVLMGVSRFLPICFSGSP